MSLFWGTKGKTESESTLTPAQETELGNMLGYYSGQKGKYASVLDQLMSGKPAFTANYGEVQERFNPIANAARRQWSQDTSKNITQGYKNVWSSARQNTLAKSHGDMESGLSQLFSQMRGKETDAARQAQQFATQMQLGGMQYGPESMLAKLLGIQGRENVVTPPSPGLFGGQGFLGIM